MAERAWQNLMALAVLMVVGALVVTFMTPGIWVGQARAVKALESQGYSNVVIRDKDVTFLRMRGCSGEDEAAFQVTAINPVGKEVEVLVCAGWPFKGATIRTR